jgi:hypothetical protein
MAGHGGGDQPLPAPASACGNGPATTRMASRISCWLQPATCRRWKCWRPFPSCASCPELKIRFINVVDLMTLQPQEEHPHGLSRRPRVRFRCSRTDKPITFRLPRLPVADSSPDLPAQQPRQLHVRGYKEEGTTTTPFDMVVLNNLDRFHLVMDVANQVPKLQAQAAHIKQVDARQAHRAHPIHPRTWRRHAGNS